MRRRDSRLVTALLSCALFCAGCGGSVYDPPKQTPGEEPFVAKGKLKSEMEAKDALKKTKKSVPAR